MSLVFKWATIEYLFDMGLWLNFGMTYDGVWGWNFFILVFAPCSPSSPWCSPRVFWIAPFLKKIPYLLPKVLPLLTYMGAKGEALYCHIKIAILGSLPNFSFLWLWWANQNDPLPTKEKEKKKEEKTIKQTWEAAHLMKRREVNSKQQMDLA